MAKVLGQEGRYVQDMASKKRRDLILVGFLGSAGLGAIVGCMLGLWLPRAIVPVPALVVPGLLSLVAIIALDKIVLRKLDTLAKQSQNMRKGAVGETRVAEVLAALPDEYCVINSLTTPFGDLDHVVVGPTGVFIVDSKNWKGVIGSDGRGELLLNGNPTEKPTVKPIVARTMNVKDKVGTLCGFEPPYFQVLLAFPSAWIQARWGTTGAATCLTDEQLQNYVAEKKVPEKLEPRKIESIAQAFLALATMDREFKRSPANVSASR